MGLFDGWLRRGISISHTWLFGGQGKPVDEGEIHCVAVGCGIKRKDHASVPHPFESIEDLES